MAGRWLSSLCLAVWLLLLGPHSNQKAQVSPRCLLYSDTSPVRSLPYPVTSFDFSCLLKILSPTTVILGSRASTYRFGGAQSTVPSQHHSKEQIQHPLCLLRGSSIFRQVSERQPNGHQVATVTRVSPALGFLLASGVYAGGGRMSACVLGGVWSYVGARF